MGYRPKKESQKVQDVALRLAGMHEIDKKYQKKLEDLKFMVDYGGPGNPLTAETYQKLLNQLRKEIEEYNSFLQQADAMKNQYEATLAQLMEDFTRVLRGGIAKFGTDSTEVEWLRGTRKSERKSKKKKEDTNT